MEIKGKVHCFFEQSGTFKNEFIKMGIPAEDYDIQNNFGQTDHVIDLFSEIDNAYVGKASIFDDITQDDLIIAFYPCTYFACVSQINFSLNSFIYRKLNESEKIEEILKRSDKRKEYYNRLIKFWAICINKNIRMIFENPWSKQTYLKANFLKPPDVIDNNRLLRGDFRIKPTAYWYINCKPTYGESYQNDKEKKIHTQLKKGKNGLCSEERSMISPDYARNFICDFILGKKQDCIMQQRLF